MPQLRETRRTCDAAGLGIGQLLAGVDCTETKPSPIELQLRFLISRFGARPEIARALAELAFPNRRAA